MTMTMDHQNSRHLGGIPFDHMHYASGPQFTNPWSAGTSNSHLYPQMSPNNMGFDAIAKQAQRSSSTSLPYASTPASAPLGTSYSGSQYGSSDLVNMSQELLNNAHQGYSAAPSSVGAYAPTSIPYPSAYGNLAPAQPQEQRKMSQATSQPSFSDALDASRGMVALSGQADLTTPRNLYDTRSDRGSTDAYGFPATHSAHSSISGASSSYNGSYASYAESVGSSSVSDYGSQSDLESVNSRTLPRPTGLMASSGLPPPQSMMGQFNSKVSSSTQKKHKCKICDKRFTRPSSLQTHMYSHTGEKPYACEAEGCGRHFSVVSNLRRHRKVHKGEAGSDDHDSPEGSWASDK